MQLLYIAGEFGADAGNPCRLIQASRDYNVFRFESAGACLDDIAVTRFVLIDRFDPHSVLHRELESVHVVFQISDDLLAREKSVRIAPRSFHSRQGRLPIWRVQREGVPAVITPCVCGLSGLFQDKMRPIVVSQVVAD